MFIALRRSATLSNSLNSAAGERALTHTSDALLFCHVWLFFVVFITANSQRLFKAWKCGTPTLQPSLTSSPPTPTSWSSCRTPPFVSGKYDLSQQLQHTEPIQTPLFHKHACFCQHLQPLSSTSGTLGNTLRSWSGWTDPNTACTCECASECACPRGHSRPIRLQTTCGGLPSSPALLSVSSYSITSCFPLQRSAVHSTFAVTLLQ